MIQVHYVIQRAVPREQCELHWGDIAVHFSTAAEARAVLDAIRGRGTAGRVVYRVIERHDSVVDF